MIINSNEKILGLLGLATRSGKIISGTDACLEYINKKKIKVLIVATDASDRTKKKFDEISKMNNIPIYQMFNIETLSKSIGKKNKAVIGIIDVNFSKEIIKRIDGGDAIG